MNHTTVSNSAGGVYILYRLNMFLAGSLGLWLMDIYMFALAMLTLEF